MTELVIVTVFNARFEAEVAKNLLEANHIQSLIRADDEGGLYPFTFMRGVSLWVTSNDMKRAKELIDTYLGNE